MGDQQNINNTGDGNIANVGQKSIFKDVKVEQVSSIQKSQLDDSMKDVLLAALDEIEASDLSDDDKQDVAKNVAEVGKAAEKQETSLVKRYWERIFQVVGEISEKLPKITTLGKLLQETCGF